MAMKILYWEILKWELWVIYLDQKKKKEKKEKEKDLNKTLNRKNSLY